MKKVLFFLFLNWTIGIIAQQNSVELIYKVKLLEWEVPEVLEDIYKTSRERVKSIEFILLGNGDNSIFYKEQTLKSEADSSLDIALSIIETDGKYYTSFQKSVVLEDKPAYGEQFIIEHPIVKEGWLLTKESKYIAKYRCYKATTTYVVNNSKGRFEFPVVAWYTPEINLPFGPKNYSGLPGLILELQEKDRVFYADKISLGKLDEKQRNLIAPPKGKKPITQAEFDAIGAKIAKERFGGR
ncbi:GLPGLI family protein [[Muricauda] lutisoli]|uniref:GLPGLI family protein n=1 Tax=[Muricauda] lutisoli TaxID=2816035 RepID=A0ABS3EX36_9FLAO|nr:GLPGLI family protein [[Muricauda] lutisoli]MBO0330744.1 GLPGLI family protein [[Muricauda] lutisoli]